MNHTYNPLLEIAQARHTELLKAAENVRVAKMAIERQQRWWTKLFHRSAQSHVLVLNKNATPQLP